jgi:hypothetical protein
MRAHRSGVISGLPGELGAGKLRAQPCGSHGPVALHGTRGAAQRCGDFFHRESGKIPHLDDPALLRGKFGEARQSFIDRKNFLQPCAGDTALRHIHIPIQLISIALSCAPRPGVVHQNTAHELGSYRNELASISPVRTVLSGQSQVRFVNQGRGLKRMVDPLGMEVMFRQSMQFAVDKRNQARQRIAVSEPQLCE